MTRFSVPRLDETGQSPRHSDASWLRGRIDLFRRFFVPSVGRFRLPTVVLCSSASAGSVADALQDLQWVMVTVQDDWYGGWTGRPEQIVTRMDSDDAIHEGWFDAVDAAPADAECCVTRRFLRFDRATAKLCAYSRRAPSPLAAFRGGRNPYAHDHATIDTYYRSHDLRNPYLLQVFHGGNVSTRRPSWYRRRLPLERLRPFGLEAAAPGDEI